MVFLAVDDEQLVLRHLTDVLQKTEPEAAVYGFNQPTQALAFAENNKIDVAFLDINMAGMNGLMLAKRLKDIYSKTNIVFVTGYSEYAVDAFSLSASGYLLKPISPEAIVRELSRLRYPIEVHYTERISIRCFGNFGLFIDEKPFLFSRAKSKELLAYLVHKRGVPVTSAEIAAILWEDKEYNRSLRSQTQTVISQLMKTLKQAGIADIIYKSWNSLAIDINKVSCDYYEFLKGNIDFINTYTGEYMNEYSWAEFVVEYLNRKIV